jgi:pimeloyl-ACP methyl ester carboxylesterase
MNSKTNLNSGYAPVHRGSLYYEVSGSGKPLLLIHAGVADCSMWDAQMAELNPYYKVIRYDTRGNGRSRTENTQFSNRQDILDLFKHLGFEKAAIIGISRGGQIAIDFTIEHPDFVSTLVAVAPGISGYEYQPGDDPQAKQEYALFYRMDELWEKKAWEELADLQVRVWADGPSQPEGRADGKIRSYMREKILADLNRQDGEATPIPLKPPAINRLGEINQATLILVGEYDTCGALAVADELECRIPNNRKVGIPGVAHMIPMEKPDVFNKLVLEFLKEEA